MTSILQWNCRGVRSNMSDLQVFLNNHNPLIVALQETKLSPNNNFTLRNYSVFRKDVMQTTLAHGGVMLAINQNLPASQVILDTPLQAVAVRVKLGRRWVTICSLYLPPGVDIPATEVEALFTSIRSPVLFLGDFNCHNSVWGGQFTNRRGRVLERLLNKSGLCTLNNGDPTYIAMPSGNPSVLDLSICSADLAPYITFAVHDDPMGSDHFPVLLRCSDTAVLGKRPPRWNFRKADMVGFQTQLDNYFNTLPEHQQVSVDLFTTIVLDAAKKFIPRTSGKPRRPPVPWFTEECRNAIRARRRAYRAFNKHSTTINLIAYRQAKAVCRRTIRQAKRVAWRSYLSKISRFSPVAQIFAQVRKINGNFESPPLPKLVINGTAITEPEDVAAKMADFFAQRCSRSNFSTEFIRHRAKSERHSVDFSTNEQLSYNAPFSLAELDSAIRSLPDVAEGPDLIHNQMLKNLPARALKFLLEAFNNLWLTGSFPSSWRRAIIVPIAKPGKTGNDAAHYRPISLTSCLCKLMEKMINVRFMWFLDFNNVLVNEQCGFRKHRTAVDHLVTLDTAVRTAFRERKHVGAVFFDIEAAYDSSWRHGILQKAFDCGIRGALGYFIKNFLHDRSFQVRVGGTLSDVHFQEEGIPQGSVMSVGLFALMINDVACTLPTSVGRSLFVDDLAIWVKSSTSASLNRQLQISINRLQHWCSKNGLKFSTSKTVAVHFCRRRRHCPDLNLNIKGVPVPCEPSAKFLGITLDRRLTYRQHILNLRERCFKALNCIKCVARTSFGADRASLLLFYRSLIRSKLDYGCFIYDSASDSIKKCLNAVHHAGLRIATGAFRTSPSTSLLVEANEPPLAIRRSMLGQRYAYKLRQLPTHPTYQSVYSRALRHSLTGFGRNLPMCVRVKRLADASGVSYKTIARLDTGETPPWELAAPITDTALASGNKHLTLPNELRQLALEHIAKYEGYTRVFTDGSRAESGVGCAFVCGSTCRGFSLPRYASIFTAELTAIYKAICFIEVSDSGKYVIFTDSLSSIMALSRFNPDHPIVKDIVLRTSSLRNIDVTVCWIPAHVGIAGNEAADAAAKRAAERRCTRALPLPASDLFPALRSYHRKLWQEEWDTYSDSKLYEVKPQIGVWSSANRRNRRQEVEISRLRIGHTLATHRYLLCGEERPLCRYCSAPLSVRHVLVSCPGCNHWRQRFFGPGEHSLRILLGDESRFIEPVLGFLRAVDFRVVFDPG